MAAMSDNRSIGDLFAELARDAGSLVRQEIRLATTEMSEKASRLGRDAAIVAAGGLVAYAGFLLILLAAVVALANVMPLGLAALVVGLVVVIVGYVLVQSGLSALRRLSLTPRETVESLKENGEWASQHLR